MKRKYEIKNNNKTKHKSECLHVLHVGATSHSTFDSVVIMEKKTPKTLIRDPPMYSLTFRLMRHVIV